MSGVRPYSAYGDEHAPRARFLGALQGLRGVLALMVVLFHLTFVSGSPFNMLGHGRLAVDGFFLLSGYVLMHAHAGDFRHWRWRAASSFLWRRWWRTYPLYAACLLLSVGLYTAFHHGRPPSPRRLAESLFLMEIWLFRGIGINIPVWSLGVEWLGYFAFPLIAWMVLRLEFRAALAASILVLMVEVTVLLLRLGPDALLPYQGLPACLRMGGAFTAGALLWRIGALRPSRGSAGRAQDDLVMLATLIALGFVVQSVTEILAIPLMAVIVYKAARPGPVTLKVLNCAPALFLGRISFALYLSHLLVLQIATMGRPFFVALPPLSLAMTIIAIAAVAIGLCFGVEEPIRRWRRRAVPAYAPARG